MPDALIAVIDVGKTNAKVIAFDTVTLAEVDQASLPLETVASDPYPHIDTERIWAHVLDRLTYLARLGRVARIIPTTHGAAAALVGEAGLALPVMDYEWDGVEAVSAEYDALRDPFDLTGSPRLPGGLNLGRQLFYQMRRHPDAYGRARAIVPFPQYWGWRLTGVHAADVSSLGSHSDLWVPAARAPSPLAVKTGLAEKLAPVRHAAAVLGPLRPEIAAATGIGADCRVAVGVHDSNASLYPFLGGGEPRTHISSGTWAIVFALGIDTSAQLDPARDCLLYVDVEGRPVPSAKAMTGREYQLFLREDAAAATSTLADARAVLRRGVIARPGGVPGVGPFPQAGGGWALADAGDPRRLPPGERAAAASLSIGLTISEMIALTRAEGPITVDGPLAANEIALQAIAARTGRAVTRAQSVGTSLGAARLALGHDAEPPAGAAVTADAADASYAGFQAELAPYAERWRQSALDR